MPEARWHQWDAVYGATQDGAPSAHAIYKLDKADVVVVARRGLPRLRPGLRALHEGLLVAPPHGRRRQDELNRLYVVEPVPTVTGSNADHRLALKSRDVHAFAAAVAAAVGAAAAGHRRRPARSRRTRRSGPRRLAPICRRNKGKSAVIAGERQPAAVHALARAINDALGNTNATVIYTAPHRRHRRRTARASLAALVAEMNAGKVDVLFILGGNPGVHGAGGSEIRRRARQGRQPHPPRPLPRRNRRSSATGTFRKRTTSNRWGDVRAFDGTVSLIQPLIAPLYDGRTAIEVLSALNGPPGVAAMDLVKEYWTEAFSVARRDRCGAQTAQAFANAESFWKNALHDGFITGTSVDTGSEGAGRHAPKGRRHRPRP